MKITKFFALLLSAVMAAASAAVPVFADEAEPAESGVITDISEGDDTASANETETPGDVILADEPPSTEGEVTITINVMFPNRIAKIVQFNDMAVTVDSLYDGSEEDRYHQVIKLPPNDDSSGSSEDDINITPAEFNYNEQSISHEEGVAGNANGYSITMTLPNVKDREYAFGITGQGYRSYAVSTTVEEGTVINIWNNVMANKMPVVTKADGTGDAKEENITFLAGDIVGSKKIDLYDLSAVISYFGTDINDANKDRYLRYDLNRDGTIDSRDIAMVLVSWGK